MIKLIACDMDGTLLDEDGNLPEGTYDLILELAHAGIRFTAASGRRYDTLRSMFSPVADSMDFVASNGAQVYARGTLVDREVFSHAAAKRLKCVVDMFDTLHLALFDETLSFLLDDEERFEREIDKNLPNPCRVYDVPSPDTSIVKASIYCDEALMDMAYVLERELGRRLRVRSVRIALDRRHAARGQQSDGHRADHASLRHTGRRGHGVRRFDERLRDHAHGGNKLRDGKRTLGHQADRNARHRAEHRAKRPTRAACTARSPSR